MYVEDTHAWINAHINDPQMCVLSVLSSPGLVLIGLGIPLFFQ